MPVRSYWRLWWLLLACQAGLWGALTRVPGLAFVESTLSRLPGAVSVVGTVCSFAATLGFCWIVIWRMVKTRAQQQRAMSLWVVGLAGTPFASDYYLRSQASGADPVLIYAYGLLWAVTWIVAGTEFWSAQTDSQEDEGATGSGRGDD